MTLFDSFMVPCVRVERMRVPDSEGGWSTQWVEGELFDAAIVLDSSISTRTAEAQGVTGVYTVTTDKGLTMGFHDVFMRLDDELTFRVTKVNDSTPNVATFQFNQYQAEEWKIPIEGGGEEIDPK